MSPRLNPDLCRQEPSGAAPEKELDLDELLDLEDDATRRAFLQRFLEDAAAAPDAVAVSVRAPLLTRPAPGLN